MMVPDNYSAYMAHEREQEREYESYRRMWLDGEISDEEWEEIEEEY